MHVTKHYMLVKIDKKAQKEKREKIGSIFLPPAFTYMKYNLQHGEITELGALVRKKFPHAEVGDTAFFHHSIEEQDWRILRTDDNGDEYRIIDAWGSPTLFFGVGKNDTGEVIPSEHWLFISGNINRIRRKHNTQLSTVNPGIWEDEEVMQAKIKELTKQQYSLAITLETTDDPYKFEEVEKAINNITKEKHHLTNLINQPKLYAAPVMFVNPEITKQTGIHANNSIVVDQDTLYPMNIQGNNFYIVPQEHVYAVANE